MSERNRFRDVACRFLIAAAVGLVVAGVAYLCAYYEMRDHPNYRYLEDYAQYELNVLREAVEKHRQTTGRLPARLTELEGVEDLRRKNDGQLLDPWKHPYQYRPEGDSFTLYSF